jgi:hypothetical protein
VLAILRLELSQRRGTIPDARRMIAGIASGAHLAWLVLPLLFFFVVRPLFWRTSGG